MNAAEAMEQGGQLHISATADDKTIELRFADSGPGIAPDVLEHIFEPFYTTKDEGTGLGLAISYTILERQGGLLQVTSIMGQGTIFTVRLVRTPLEPDLTQPQHLAN
jgi:two-component system NtrC family sensor kinase